MIIFDKIVQYWLKHPMINEFEGDDFKNRLAISLASRTGERCAMKDDCNDDFDLGFLSQPAQESILGAGVQISERIIPIMTEAKKLSQMIYSNNFSDDEREWLKSVFIYFGLSPSAPFLTLFRRGVQS